MFRTATVGPRFGVNWLVALYLIRALGGGDDAQPVSVGRGGAVARAAHGRAGARRDFPFTRYVYDWLLEITSTALTGLVVSTQGLVGKRGIVIPGLPYDHCWRLSVSNWPTRCSVGWLSSKWPRTIALDVVPLFQLMMSVPLIVLIRHGLF